MKLSELLKMDLKKPPLYQTNISFIDNNLGGFELGQIITISGDSEAGKTKLLEQILTEVSKGFKCLYFALEFNNYQVWRYFTDKLKNGYITLEQTENIEIITTEETDTEIEAIIGKIKYHIAENKVTFVAIDSAINLYHNSLSGEQETTEIFRLLQKLAIANNILLMVIAQSSKEENKDNRVGIFGSQKAKHYVNMMLHIFFDEEKEERKIRFAKNKQNGFRKTIDVWLNPKTLTFDTWLGEYKIKQDPFNDSDVVLAPKEWKSGLEKFME